MAELAELPVAHVLCISSFCARMAYVAELAEQKNNRQCLQAYLCVKIPQIGARSFFFSCCCEDANSVLQQLRLPV